MTTDNPYDPQRPVLRVDFRDEQNLDIGTADLPSVPSRGDHVRIIERNLASPIYEVVSVRWELGDIRYVVVTLRRARVGEGEGR